MSAATLDLTPAQSDRVLDVVESLVRTGHNDSISVDRPREWDEQQSGVYITGYKRAALDRCAFVADNGEIRWLR